MNNIQLIKYNIIVIVRCFFCFVNNIYKKKLVINDLSFRLCYRSKSRSVDHGLAAPYDLDSLRSKVEGRFDSVERLSKGELIYL